MAKLDTMDAYSALNPVGAELISTEGISYPCMTATVEHRPTGVSASMATVRLPVLVDIESIDPYPKFEDGSRRNVTPPRNLEFTVLRESSTFTNGTAPVLSGLKRYIDLPESAETQDADLDAAQKSQKNNDIPLLNLSEILESGFDLKIGGGFVRAGDGVDQEIYREMTFSDLLVKYVNGLKEYPMALNEVCIVEVVLFDRRDRWALLTNFNDQINRTKGVDTQGNVGYYNESCFNPFASQADRRYWNANDLFSYLVHLIDGIEIGGSRGTGYVFDENAVGKRISANLRLGDRGETVDDLEVYGGNPAQILDQFLKRWGCTLIFPHTGEWYITETDIEFPYPSRDIYQYSTAITPQNFNPVSLRAKELVVYGPDAQFQEGFNGLVLGTDFDYVVPYFGYWVRLDHAWFLCKNTRNGAVNLGTFEATKSYLSAADWARLSLLSAVPTGDDYEAYFFEAAQGGDISIEVARLIISVAENGFKFIRLRRDGTYGKTRKPLPNLVSVDSLGDSNRPVIIADSWASADVRAAVQAPYSDWDENTGLSPLRLFESEDVVDAQLHKNAVANRNKQVKVFNYSQGMTLVDAEALVFSFAKKLIYPTGIASDTSSTFELAQEARPTNYTGSQPTISAADGRGIARAQGPDGSGAFGGATLDEIASFFDGEDEISAEAQEALDEILSQEVLEPAKIIDMLDVYKNGGLNLDRTNALIQMYTDQDWSRASRINILVASYVPVGMGKGEGNVVSTAAYQKRYKSAHGWDGTAYRYMDFLQAKFILGKQSIAVESVGNDEVAQTYKIVPAYSNDATLVPHVDSLNGDNQIENGGPIQYLRDLADSGAIVMNSYFNQLDRHCDRFAADYFNRLRHKLGVDYTFVGIRVPAGGVAVAGGSAGDGGTQGSPVIDDGEFSFFYNPELQTVMWHIDDEGAFTMARYNNPDAFTPFVSQYERQTVDFLNQQRQFNGVTSLNEFAKQVRKMSAGRHIE